MARSTHSPTAQLPTSHVLGAELLHEGGQVSILRGPKHEVPVVGHKAIRANPHRPRFKRLLQKTFKGGIVLFLGKQLHPAHASIQNVEQHPSRGNSCGTRHPQRLPQPSPSLNKRAVPLSCSLSCSAGSAAIVASTARLSAVARLLLSPRLALLLAGVFFSCGRPHLDLGGQRHGGGWPCSLAGFFLAGWTSSWLPISGLPFPRVDRKGTLQVAPSSR